MASLQDKKIKDTYEGLLKTEDNLALGAVDTKVTDGSGTDTGITINSNGNVGVSGKITFGELSDSTGNSVNKVVNQAEGIDANNNDTSLPTVAAVKDYVDNSVTAQDLDFTGNTGSGAIDLDSESLNIAGSNGISTTANGNSVTVDGSSLQNRISDAEQDILVNINDIDSLQVDVASNDSDILDLQDAITDETSARIAADSNLQNAINTNSLAIQNEEGARISADNALQFDIDVNSADITAEELARINADAAIQASINTETSNREAADVSLQNQITSNDSELTALTSRIAVNETDIDLNTSAITSNQIDISVLQSSKQDNISAGSGISITGTTVSNTSPDQTVVITGSGSTTVTGTYPTFNVESVGTEYIGGAGIDVTGATITNTSPDQIVSITGQNGTSVAGTYPSFTVDSSSLESDIAAEAAARSSADLTLQGNIDSEETNRIAGDAALQSQITSNDSDITALQSGKEDKVNKGAVNGYAPLDSGAKINEAYLPDSILGQVSYQGTWDANTNTPALPDPTLNKGHYYVVSVEGTYLGVDYNLGDWVISNEVIWEKLDNTDAVTTVFGRLGAVLANESDYSAFYPLLSDLAATDAQVATNVTDIANLQTLVTGTENDVFALSSDLTQEVTDRTNADSALQAQITSNDGDITSLQSSKQDNLTAGTGIGLAGGVVTNTAPDQTVSLTAGTNVTISGTYPDFTINSTTEPAPVDSVNGYTGVVSIDSDDVAEGSVNLYDKTVSITGAGATTVTGTYPNFNIESTDTLYTEGAGIDITAGVVTNTAPDQLVTITNSGSATVTGTYPNFNVDATDTNTTYTAGTGLDLTGTVFSNTAPDQTVTITGGSGVDITGTYPDFTIASVAGSQVIRDLFSGTGSQTAFTLSGTPVNENYTQVFISGVYQEKSGYTVSGNTLTFSEAPANLDVIEVISITTITILGEVSSVNGQIGAVVLDSDDISEGTTNKFLLDDSVTYDKLGVEYTTSAAVAASDIDFSTAQVFTKTLTGATAFTFTNASIGMVKDLLITGDFALTFPTGSKIATGEYDGTVANLIQVLVVGAADYWITISQEVV